LLCIYTDDNGLIYIEMMMYKVVFGAGSKYWPTNGATGFTMSTGWNWIGIKVETIWGFSYVTFYQSYESLNTGNR